MKRKIIQTRKRIKLQKQALANMRKARENIDPDLIQEARKAIAKSLSGQRPENKTINDKSTDNNADKKIKKQDGIQKSVAVTPHNEQGSVQIDRQKNLKTIITLMNGLDKTSALYQKIEKDMQSMIKDK